MKKTLALALLLALAASCPGGDPPAPHHAPDASQGNGGRGGNGGGFRDSGLAPATDAADAGVVGDSAIAADVTAAVDADRPPVPGDGPAAPADTTGLPNGAPGSYTLDLSDLQDRSGRSPLFVQNRAVLVFPIDLSARARAVSAVAPHTIQSVDTRVPCPAMAGTETGAIEVLGLSLGAAAIPRKDTAVVEHLDLEMPYEGKPVMDAPLRPSALCLGARRAGGDWVWSFVPTNAVLDDAGKKATARLDVSRLLPAGSIDAIAVLFETRAFVRTVRFQVRQ